jgi:hypothetical protein
MDYVPSYLRLHADCYLPVCAARFERCRWCSVRSQRRRALDHRLLSRQDAKFRRGVLWCNSAYRSVFGTSVARGFCTTGSLEVAILLPAGCLLSLSYLSLQRGINENSRVEDAHVGAGAVLGAVVFTTLAVFVPAEAQPLDTGGSIDLFGTCSGIGGLVLFNSSGSQVEGLSLPNVHCSLNIANAS